MNSNPKGVIEQLSAESLEKCLLRLSKAAAAAWQLLDVKVSAGTIADAVEQYDFKNPAAAVYFSLGSADGLTALMLFRPEDIDCISRCFTKNAFPRGQRTTPAEEMMLQEVGNIVLNALLNSVLNAVKKSAMPVVPQFVEGDAARVAAGLGAAADLKRVFRVIKAELAIRCDKCEGRSEVFVMLPEELASGLERVLPLKTGLIADEVQK